MLFGHLSLHGHLDEAERVLLMLLLLMLMLMMLMMLMLLMMMLTASRTQHSKEHMSRGTCATHTEHTALHVARFWNDRFTLSLQDSNGKRCSVLYQGEGPMQ